MIPTKFLIHLTTDKFFIFCILVICSSLSTKTIAADFYSKNPILTLDIGGHAGTIKDIKFTANGNFIVSAGDDKVIRIWDWRKGNTVRKIYGQVGKGNAGKIFAMAISHDDRWLAVGGWFDKHGTDCLHCGDIRLFDFQTGRLIKLLQGHKNVVHSLAFSNNGNYLVSGSADKTAILWDFSKKQILTRLEGHTSKINAVMFTPDSQNILTASDDGFVLLWPLIGGKPERTISRHKGKALSLVISKYGLIASGGSSGNIHLSRVSISNFSKTISNNKKEVSDLAFSKDGSYLISTCGFGCGSAGENIIWETTKFNKIGSYKGHDNVVSKAIFHPIENIAVTAGGSNHEIHIWTIKEKKIIQKLSGVGKTVWSAAFTEDEKYIAWGNKNPCREENSCPNKKGVLEWVLRLPEYQVPIGRPEMITEKYNSFLRTKQKYGFSTLAHKKGGGLNLDDGELQLHLNNKLKKIIIRDRTNGNRHSSYSFLTEGKFFVSGGAHGVLTAYYGNDGQDIADFVGHTNNIWALAVSEKNKLLLSASSDQTLKLWDISQIEEKFQHKPIVSLFYATNGEFIIWVPEGYFYSSPHGDKFVGWIINQGPDKEARYVTARELRHHLFSPELVRKAIMLRNSKKARRELRGKDIRLTELLRNKSPDFKIVSHNNQDKITTSSTTIEIKLAPNNADLKQVDIFVNNFHVSPSTSKAIGVKKVNDPNRRSYRIPIQKGKNLIKISMQNEWGQTEKFLSLEGNIKGDLDKKGDMYIISIGVDDYPFLPPICGGPGGECQLDFASKDATALFETFSRKTGQLYKLVKSSILLTTKKGKQATSANIRNALRILRKAKDQDIIILFLSGHGLIDGDDYLFLTNNAKKIDGEWDYDSVLSWRDIANEFQRTKGLRLMFIDSCHSGGAYNARFAKDTSDHEIFALSATDEKTLALELRDLKHGAFAYALKQGIEGQADKFVDGKVTISELMAYIMHRVPELTDNKQIPEVNARKIKDFIIAE